MALFRGRGRRENSTDQSIQTTRRLPETEELDSTIPTGIPTEGKVVVTIARQCGSGGSEIGRILARKHNLNYLDHEIISEIARRSGIPVEQAESQDEQTTGPLNYVLEALNFNTPFNLNYSKLLQHRPTNLPSLPREQAYFHLTQRVVREMASEGDAVIIGRGSQFLLRDHPRTLHVYIFAPRERRIANVMEHFQIAQAQAIELIERRDGDTEHYHRHYYGSSGTQPEHYHLWLNTGLFSFELGADLIAQALPLVKEMKTGKLAL